MLCDGQCVFGGVNVHATDQADLHRHAHGRNRDIAVNFNAQTAGALHIVLNNITGVDDEHRAVCIGADKGNIGILHTHQSNGNGSIADFLSTGMDGHRNFHILNVVLVEGEYAVFIVLTGNGRGSITAAVVSDLEALVNSTATLDFYAAGAGNEAVNIQIATVFYGDLTVSSHLHEGQRTVGHTVITVLGAHLTGQAHCTVDSQVCTACQIQSTEHAGCAVGFSGRCTGGAQGACSIIGNIQGDAGRNGVVACCQSCIACQSDGLVGRAACIADGCIQAFKQLCSAVCVEHRCGGGIGEYCLHSYILCGNQRISSCGGNYIVGCSIDPGNKLVTAAGGCHKGSTGRRADRVDRAGCNGCVVHLDAA